ncbi:Cytoplasmic polyadenylation element-binding protein 4 [Liparis tanakae]|uniref:Cytoplasmic polyadenylation element-binding protein 4 n=1 Tax=Liparis tanakae TaxID=230148 RepID=A0A4Z2ED78_9TELE|nr:Cytoplasmic polyadenylation element-binding protein 4 [Liparis tanakae]
MVVFLSFQQERTRSFDGFSMHSLENSLIDIMRAEQDSLKGRYSFSHQAGDGPLPMNGTYATCIYLTLMSATWGCRGATSGPIK